MAKYTLRRIADWLFEPGNAAGIYYDAFQGEIMISAPTEWGSEPDRDGPRAWTDLDDHLLALHLQRQKIDTTQGDVAHAVEIYAAAHARDPLREYAESLPGLWDGEPRLATWLSRYLGARPDEESQPDRYLELAGTYTLRAAIARAAIPRAEVHSVLVIEGPQGVGKTTLLKNLGGPFYSGRPIPFNQGREAPQALHGSWIHELGELAKVTGKSMQDVKAFVTNNPDRYKPPYGRKSVTRWRRCIFVATVDRAQYLVDTAGNRRWWPVWCPGIRELGGKADHEAFIRDRTQLLAEAARDVLVDGLHWHPIDADEEALFRSASDARMVDDPLLELIEEQIEGLEFIATSVLMSTLELKTDPRAMHRVARCMQQLGWTYTRRMSGSGDKRRVRRGYAAPGVETPGLRAYNSNR